MKRSCALGLQCRWVALVAVIVSFLVTESSAIPRSWNGGSGDWSVPALWNPNGLPGSGDETFISPTDGVSRTVTYNYAGPTVTLQALLLDLTGPPGAATTLAMPGNSLSATNQYVGYSGSAAFNQTGGTVDVDETLFVGYSFGSTGELFVSGASTTLESAWLSLGTNGEGQLTIENGGTVSVQNKTGIGDGLNSVGTALVSGAGSTLEFIGWVDVGSFGDGTLTINNQGLATGNGMYIGGAASGSGQLYVSNPGSAVDAGFISVGNQGQGELFLSDGGVATTEAGIVIGAGLDSFGAASISGSGSKLHAAWYLAVGDASVGSLLVENGGVAEADNSFSIGTNATGIGEARVTGTGSRLEGEWDVVTGNLGQGTLTVENGGLVTSPGWLIVGNQSGSHGSLYVNAGGTATTAQTIAIGHLAGSSGQAFVSGTGAKLLAGWMDVGKFAEGSLTIDDGGLAQIQNGTYIGGDATGEGEITVTGTGSKLQSVGWIDVGTAGHGKLILRDGGQATSGSLGIGTTVSGVGQVVVDGVGSAIQTNFGISVGSFNDGMLSVSSGGSVSALNGFEVGSSASGSGQVSVTGTNSSVSGAWYLVIGVSGEGTLTVGDGGAASTAGDFDVATQAGSSGVVHINSGGGVTTAVNSHVGGWWQQSGGQGRVNINSGGTFNVTGTLTIWNMAGNAVNLHGGTINTTGLNFNGNPSLLNWTSGTLHLTTSVTFDSSAPSNTTGAAFGFARTVSGGRTLKITGNETLGGVGSFGLNISTGGVHEVTGTLAISPFGALHLHNGGTITADTIQHMSGGTFNFTGGTLHVETFHGNLINAGGTLAPGNSPGTTTVFGNYTQSVGKLEIEIGAAEYDSLVVNGDASFGGVLEVLLTGGYSPEVGATFNILDWTGTRSGEFSLSLPALTGSLAWNTSDLYITGELSVVRLGYFGDVNLDGAVDTADYVAWRKTDSANPTGYIDFVRNFGQGTGGGSGSSLGSAAQIPEPSATILLLSALLGRALLRATRSPNPCCTVIAA
jgi:T5SS/PEP-CTERM-associated repeat protein